MAETVTCYAALPNTATWPVQEKQEDAEEEEGKSTEEGGSSTPTMSCLSRSSSSSSLSTSESCCLNISWLDEALLESLLACKELRGMAAGQRRLLQAGTSGQEDPKTSTSRSTSTLPWKAWEETEERFNPDGEMWQQKHRRKRVQHLSPRDLKKALRKAEAIRAQLDGHRERTCERHCNASLALGAPAPEEKVRYLAPAVVQGRNLTFEDCRKTLLARSTLDFEEALRPAVAPAPGWVSAYSADIYPVSLASSVQSRFMETVNTSSGGRLRMTLHGTPAGNIPSILGKGLLVPGTEGVGVANGQSHGRGIYTAELGQVGANLALEFSRGFLADADFLPAESAAKSSPVASLSATRILRCRESDPPENAPPKPALNHEQKHLLLCGVVDDSRPVPPQRIGNFILTARSDSVSHVGQAIIVHDGSYVAPMYLARLTRDVVWFGGQTSMVTRTEKRNKEKDIHLAPLRGCRPPPRRVAPRTPAPTPGPPRFAAVELLEMQGRMAERAEEMNQLIEKLHTSEEKMKTKRRAANRRRCRAAARVEKLHRGVELWS